jgi:nucleotide-binding universal stress UspA family protein
MGGIVVGMDGSDGSAQALKWALEEARLRGSEVRACFSPCMFPLAGLERLVGVEGHGSLLAYAQTVGDFAPPLTTSANRESIGSGPTISGKPAR